MLRSGNRNGLWRGQDFAAEYFGIVLKQMPRVPLIPLHTRWWRRVGQKGHSVQGIQLALVLE